MLRRLLAVEIVAVVLIGIELHRYYPIQGRLVVSLKNTLASYQNEPLRVPLSSFDRCSSFAVHVAVYVGFTHHLPLIC